MQKMTFCIFIVFSEWIVVGALDGREIYLGKCRLGLSDRCACQHK